MHRTQLEGELTLPQFIADLGITSPEDCHGRTCWYLDLMKASLSFTGKEIQKLAEYLLQYRSAGQCKDQDCHVAVAATDDLTFGLLRMLQVHVGEDIQLHVARSQEDALEWLFVKCGATLPECA